jgi:hypothetical protein
MISISVRSAIGIYSSSRRPVHCGDYPHLVTKNVSEKSETDGRDDSAIPLMSSTSNLSGDTDWKSWWLVFLENETDEQIKDTSATEPFYLRSDLLLC